METTKSQAKQFVNAFEYLIPGNYDDYDKEDMKAIIANIQHLSFGENMEQLIDCITSRYENAEMILKDKKLISILHTLYHYFE